MTNKVEVERLESSPSEHYREENAELNEAIQVFNTSAPGDRINRGAGVQGDSPATSREPALEQGYPVPMDVQKTPGREMPGAAEKTKRREGEVEPE